VKFRLAHIQLAWLLPCNVIC